MEQNTENRRQLIEMYHAVYTLHTWITATLRTTVADFLISAEVLIILSLFIVIRLKLKLGIMSVLAMFVGGVLYFCMEIALNFAADLTDISKEFCQPSSGRPLSLSKEEKCRLATCRPLKIVIGNTFTVTKQTILTISQDIILMSLINLLVNYK